MASWQLQEARSRFKDLIDAAIEKGPQRVTRRGEPAVVVVSEKEWERVTGNVPSFGKLIASCPASSEDLPARRTARVIRRRTFG